MADEYRRSDLLVLILRRWWVVLIGVATGILVSLVLLQVTPNQWTATATQLVKGVPGTGAGADYTAAQYAEARAISYPSFILSAPVLQGVQDDMGPEFTNARLREDLSASSSAGTPLVRVTANGASAEEARDLANSAARRLATFITEIERVEGRSPVIVEIAVEAGLPRYPASPSRGLYLAMGFSGGLAIGILAVLGWVTLERLRPRAV